MSRRVLNISREGDSTTSLGSLGQGSIILRGKKEGKREAVFPSLPGRGQRDPVQSHCRAVSLRIQPEMNVHTLSPSEKYRTTRNGSSLRSLPVVYPRQRAGKRDISGSIAGGASRPGEELAGLDPRWLRSLEPFATSLKGCWSRKSCGAQLPTGSSPQRSNSSKQHSNAHRSLTISKPSASAVSSRLNCNSSNGRNKPTGQLGPCLGRRAQGETWSRRSIFSCLSQRC